MKNLTSSSSSPWTGVAHLRDDEEIDVAGVYQNLEGGSLLALSVQIDTTQLQVFWMVLDASRRFYELNTVLKFSKCPAALLALFSILLNRAETPIAVLLQCQ